eukprot:13072801-Alexandrium_andersonii.AAC.1
MLTPHAQAPARGPPSTERPGEVSVHKCANGGAGILPREGVHAPGTDDQVAHQPNESSPISGRGR